jgi:two-component system sensor histidine kinase AtoS
MFTTVLDSIEAIIYVSDMETYKILYLNKYARNIFGDIDGKVCWQNTQPGLEGPCEFCSKDKLLTPEGEPAGVYHREFYNALNNTWYDVYDRAIEWVDGRIVRFEISTDITERKKVDETLRRAEQMNLVGEWAAGLAHEIKNALAGIKISVEVLAEELDLTEEDKKPILQATDEVKRIELLLKKMLDFAKPPELLLATTNINEILDNSVTFSMIQISNTSEAAQRVKVLKDYDDNLPNIMADPLQLRQVFMNIIMNANDAMGNSGTLTLKTSYDEVRHNIFIEFSDSGEGLEKDIIDDIFKPFFTTKSKGSGLGLAISRRIVELHGGKISVENKPDRGALFSITIPVETAER